MVDVARDARWGRIMEGAGEDPYLGAQVAQARIRGFQGDDLTRTNTMLACAKHYVAYGAARGGRDYNTVDMSMRRLHETYLPPFRAAVDEGVATFMSSFNEFNGVPVTGSRKLVRGLLKEEWGFDGFIVSDWASVREMIVHGIAGGEGEAGALAMQAGIDMDMEGHIYIHQLKSLLEEGKITSDMINDAVRRILTKKFELGLFDDPYRYCDVEREKQVTLSHEHRAFARKAAARSMVLLKNEPKVLPLSKDLRSIALIGPLVKAKKEYLGTWSARGEARHVVSVMEGFRNRLGNDVNLLYARGAGINGEDRSGFSEALEKARQADAIVAVVGESAMMSGEALSRMHLGLPGVQEELVGELAALGKPLAVVLMNGRPLAIPEIDKKVPAILEAWLPGTEGGHAVADVLFGDVNPSGRLTASFPWHVGQVPVYYAHKNTGRPKKEDERYTSKYIDGPNEPLYPFGYGLSYTSFVYSKPAVSHDRIRFGQTLQVEVTVENTGNREGEELVQLYIRDMVGSVTRPVKELKGFRKIALRPGERETVVFELTHHDLAFYTRNMEYKAEPGRFQVMTGPNSRDLKTAGFKLIP
jgi:beta-glucosidase